jgi:hypothetical protein
VIVGYRRCKMEADFVSLRLFTIINWLLGGYSPLEAEKFISLPVE